MCSGVAFIPVVFIKYAYHYKFIYTHCHDFKTNFDIYTGVNNNERAFFIEILLIAYTLRLIN